jgi:hypothetical protein
LIAVWRPFSKETSAFEHAFLTALVIPTGASNPIGLIVMRSFAGLRHPDVGRK